MFKQISPRYVNGPLLPDFLKQIFVGRDWRKRYWPTRSDKADVVLTGQRHVPLDPLGQPLLRLDLLQVALVVILDLLRELLIDLVVRHLGAALASWQLYLAAGMWRTT